MVSAIAAYLARCGDSLDERRVARWSARLLAFEILCFLFFVAGTHGLMMPLKTPASTDFVSFYAAGSLADQGTPQLAYDHAAHYAAEQAAAAPGIKYNYFYYPPVFLLVCALLARLPYLLSFVTFQAASGSLYLLAVMKILRQRRWAVLLPVVAFPPVLWNLGVGQTGFLTAALFAAATLLVDRRPIVAGMLFGAVCYKPDFGLLIPVALAAAGNWRGFAAAAAAVAGLVLLSVLAFGGATWQAFLEAALHAAPVYAGKVKLAGYASAFGAVRFLHGPPAVAVAVQAVAALAAVAAVALAWRRGSSLSVRGAVLCSAAIITAPVAMWYDLLLAGVAGAWLCAGGALLPAERVVLALLFVAALDPILLSRLLGVPACPLIAIVFFALTARVGWREATLAAAPRPGTGASIPG